MTSTSEEGFGISPKGHVDGKVWQGDCGAAKTWQMRHRIRNNAVAKGRSRTQSGEPDSEISRWDTDSTDTSRVVSHEEQSIRCLGFRVYGGNVNDSFSGSGITGGNHDKGIACKGL